MFFTVLCSILLGLQSGSKKSSSTGIIIGAAAGGCVLVLLLIVAGVYALRQRRRADTADKKNDPFGIFEINTIFNIFCFVFRIFYS